VNAENAPYPPSPVVRGITWHADVVKCQDGIGDNWPITWVDEDLQVTAYGDGVGFDGHEQYLSLGFSRIRGDPPHHRGQDFASDADTPAGGGPDGIKASGLLMVDGALYLFVRNYRPEGSDDYKNSRLAWSRDLGVNWRWADWHFADTFGCPEFVQFGPNYRGARDNYVYIASQGNNDAYLFSPDIVLARAPRDRVPQRGCYEFFAGADAAGLPLWSADIADRRPIFTDPLGTQRIAVTYNAALGRYLLTTSHRPPGNTEVWTPALGVFDAPEPWGPWTTVCYRHDWSAPWRTYHHKFPTKWMSADGRVMWLLFSGIDEEVYTFCLRKATLELVADGS